MKKIDPLKRISSEDLLRVFFNNGGCMDRRNFCVPVQDTREARRAQKALILLLVRYDGREMMLDVHRAFLKGEVDSRNTPVQEKEEKRRSILQRYSWKLL